MPSIGSIAARNTRAERARRGWRQAELAERLGWSVTKVGDIETGRRRVSADQLVELCKAFEIPLRRLLDDAEASDLVALGIEPLR